jgi:hypothetical protein
MAPRDPADDPRLARERMTTLAAELARRSTKEHLKAQAMAAGEELKAKATVMARAKATEVKDDMKQRARAATIGRVETAFAGARGAAGDLATDIATDIKEQAMGSKTSSVLGAVAGATAGVVLARALDKRKSDGAGTRGQAYGYGYGYGPGISELGSNRRSFDAGTSQGAGIGQTARDGVDSVRGAVGSGVESVRDAVGSGVDQVRESLDTGMDHVREGMHDVSHRIGETVEGAKHQAHVIADKIPSVGEMRAGANGFMRDAIDEQPLLLAVGALVLGGIAGLLVPVTDGERKAFEPLKSKAVEGVQKLGDAINVQLEAKPEQPKEEQGASYAPDYSEQRVGASIQSSAEATTEESVAYSSQVADRHVDDDAPEESEGDRPRGILDDAGHTGALH